MCAKKNKKNKNRGERIFIPYEKEDKGPSWVVIGILCLVQLYPVAFFLLALKLHAKWKSKKLIDFRNYAAIIGERYEVDIRELSAKLGKPSSQEHAKEMLADLSDNWHSVYTGLTLINTRSGKVIRRADRTRVHFVKLSEADIEAYVAGGECMDKAGAYGIQGDFAIHVKGIEGDYYNVVGLPIGKVYQELKRLL